MKKVFFTLLMVLSEIVGMSQTIGEAFYIYRNDGQINVFFRDEVDSITYSHYDADSLFYDEIVTQLVYTADSTYCIPLAAIDSVGFVKPETKYKEDAIPLIGSLFDYIISSDSLSLTFNLSIPSAMLPNVGDKLVATDLTDKLPVGFLGKVRQVVQVADGYVVTCDSLALEEVVDRFYGIVEIVGQEGNGNARRYLRRSLSSGQTRPFRLIIPTISQNLDLTSFVKPKKVFGINGEIDGKALVNVTIDPVISGRITRVVDNFLHISHYNIHAHLDVATITKIELAGEINNEDNPFNQSNPKRKLCVEGTKLGPYFIPIYYAFGPLLDASGELALGTTVHVNFTQTEDITYYPLTASVGALAPPVFNLVNTVSGQTKMTLFDIDWVYIAGKISARVAVCGRLGIGIAGKGHNLGWVGGEAQAGFKGDAELGFDFETLSNAEKGTGFYDGVKDNAKVVVRPYWGLEGKVSFLDDRYSFAFVGSDDYSFWGKKWEWDLLPKFSDTKSKMNNNYSAEISANITNDCIFPLTVGFSLFDENGNRVGEPQWNEKKYWAHKDFSLPYCTTFNDLAINKKYKAYPTLSLFGFKVLASPSAEIGITPVTLEAENVSETTAKVWGKIEGHESLDNAMKFGLGYVETESTDSVLYDASSIDADGVFSVDFMALKPSTTYKYFAYLTIDGETYYGEDRKFTTKEEVNKESYCAFNSDNTVLTYYYDDKREIRHGYKIENVNYATVGVSKVVFDSSYKHYDGLEIINFEWGGSIETIEGLGNVCFDNVKELNFRACGKLKYLDLSGVNTSKITNMSGMFAGCSSLKNLSLSSFDTSNVKDMSAMFYQCSSLESLDVSSFDTSNVENMGGMFFDCESLKEIDVSNFDTSNVTNMASMFRWCYSLEHLDVTMFNTENVVDMGGMFEVCKNLLNLNVSNFVTSNVTDMGGMFDGCKNLTCLNVSNFVTSKVTKMQSMFSNCSFTDLDLTNFDTSNVTNMSWMFCRTPLVSLNLSSFNTSKVTDMSHMFYHCSSMKKLDLSNFDFTNTESMQEMFSYCSSLEILDISRFGSANSRTILAETFYNCSSLKTIYGSNLNREIGGLDTFYGCNNLVGGMGSKIGNNFYGYDIKGNPLYYYCSNNGSAAHIDGGKDNPGLFTAK